MQARTTDGYSQTVDAAFFFLDNDPADVRNCYDACATRPVEEVGGAAAADDGVVVARNDAPPSAPAHPPIMQRVDRA